MAPAAAWAWLISDQSVLWLRKGIQSSSFMNSERLTGEKAKCTLWRRL